MNSTDSRPSELFSGYADRLQGVLSSVSWEMLEPLAVDLLRCWRQQRQVFLCGNGGSAANAMHLANDFLYGISRGDGPGLRVHALSANSSVLTCLGNDCGYPEIFAKQLEAQARPHDLVVALSGSGNSPNIVRVLEQARAMGVVSYAILGYSGGTAKALADVVIHFAVDDMQIAEDLQLVVGHMLMRWLRENRSQAQ